MRHFAYFAGFRCFPVWLCSMTSITTNIPSRLKCSGVITFARLFQRKEVPVLISLIAPAYNEEGNIVPFARSVASAFKDLPGGVHANSFSLMMGVLTIHFPPCVRFLMTHILKNPVSL